METITNYPVAGIYCYLMLSNIPMLHAMPVVAIVHVIQRNGSQRSTKESLQPASLELWSNIREAVACTGMINDPTVDIHTQLNRQVFTR